MPKRRKKRVVVPADNNSQPRLKKIKDTSASRAKAKVKKKLSAQKKKEKQQYKDRFYKAKAKIKENVKDYRKVTSKSKALKVDIPTGYMKTMKLTNKKPKSAREARNMIKDYIRANTKITGEWLYNMGYEPDGSTDFFVQLFIENDRYYDGYTLTELYEALRDIGGDGTIKFYNYVKNLFDAELRKELN